NSSMSLFNKKSLFGSSSLMKRRNNRCDTSSPISGRLRWPRCKISHTSWAMTLSSLPGTGSAAARGTARQRLAATARRAKHRFAGDRHWVIGEPWLREERRLGISQLYGSRGAAVCEDGTGGPIIMILSEG